MQTIDLVSSWEIQYLAERFEKASGSGELFSSLHWTWTDWSWTCSCPRKWDDWLALIPHSHTSLWSANGKSIQTQTESTWTWWHYPWKVNSTTHTKTWKKWNSKVLSHWPLVGHCATFHGPQTMNTDFVDPSTSRANMRLAFLILWGKSQHLDWSTTLVQSVGWHLVQLFIYLVWKASKIFHLSNTH